MIPLTPEQCRAVQSAGEMFVRLEDPETHRAYVLMDQEVFDRWLAWVQPLREAWDDPAMDVYNDYQPPSAQG